MFSIEFIVVCQWLSIAMMVVGFAATESKE